MVLKCCIGKRAKKASKQHSFRASAPAPALTWWCGLPAQVMECFLRVPPQRLEHADRTRPGVCTLVAPTLIVLPSLTSADCSKGSSVCTCSWLWPREAFLRTQVPEMEKQKAVLCGSPSAGLCFLPWDLDSHGSSPLPLPQQFLLGAVNLPCPPLNSLQFRFLSQHHLFPSEA